MQIKRKNIFKDYKWLKEKNKFFIISADYDGLICASFLHHHLNFANSLKDNPMQNLNTALHEGGFNLNINPDFKASCFSVVLFFNAVFAIFAALS